VPSPFLCRADANQEATREEYEAKLKEIEKVANPVISKLMKAGKKTDEDDTKDK
jgi:hypothetical protein